VRTYSRGKGSHNRQMQAKALSTQESRHKRSADWILPTNR
jgi:hypothetical protein